MRLPIDLAKPSAAPASLPAGDPLATWPIVICILGSFRVLRHGRPVALPSGGRAELLLRELGWQHPAGVERERLLELLWPDSSTAAAGHSVNSLIHALRRTLGDAIDDAAPVVLSEGRYHLNTAAGVGLDLACFDELVARSAREERAGDHDAAMASARRAVLLYRGDLAVDGDIAAIIQRERLRTLYLSALARLAGDAFRRGDDAACLGYTLELLVNDPCREDAHRLVMRCHLRRGERSQALRQYRLCAEILRREFDAVPEPETAALYDAIRLDPGGMRDGG